MYDIIPSLFLAPTISSPYPLAYLMDILAIAQENGVRYEQTTRINTVGAKKEKKDTANKKVQLLYYG